MIQVREQRCHRDHEQWGSLPAHLVEHVRDYVWEARKLIDPERETPAFLHGDLHAGNVFVDGEPGALEPTGIVDFNDAYEGDPHYDLVAIHAKAFGADKRLLRALLDGYGWGELGKQWPRRMMALTLAHDYDMIQPVADRYPEALAAVGSLDELATPALGPRRAGPPVGRRPLGRRPRMQVWEESGESDVPRRPLAPGLRAGRARVIVISRPADGVILEANEAWCRLMGYGRDEVIGRSTLELGLWVDPGERNAIIARVRQELAADGLDHRLPAKGRRGADR